MQESTLQHGAVLHEGRHQLLALIQARVPHATAEEIGGKTDVAPVRQSLRELNLGFAAAFDPVKNQHPGHRYR